MTLKVRKREVGGVTGKGTRTKTKVIREKGGGICRRGVKGVGERNKDKGVEGMVRNR